MFRLVSFLGLFALFVFFPLFGNFSQEMDKQINRAEQHAARKLMEMQGEDSPRNIAQFNQAFKMLLVKQSLKRQFAVSSSANSPRVQQALLRVIKLQDITEADLLELQRIVIEDKRQS